MGHRGCRKAKARRETDHVLDALLEAGGPLTDKGMLAARSQLQAR
jgi:hypothetical protein